MKTLNQEIAAIKAANISKSAKKEAFIKLGLTSYEADILIWQDAENAAAKESTRFTFGVEIECFVNRGAIRTAAATTGLAYEYEGYNHRDGHSYFKFVRDGSVTGMDDPIECVSPVLQGVKGTATLKKACRTLKKANAKVNQTCGLHVHIGAAKLTEQQFCNVFVNYMMLESLIDSFMAESRRGNNAFYARSLRNQEYSLLRASKIAAIQNIFGNVRYQKVNPYSYNRHKTIEFRQHQGTTDFEKISNWVSFCGKLVIWSKNNRLTSPIASIDEIPFLNEAEIEFFKSRASHFASR